MIQTIIADDEAPARERLRDLLERFSKFDIIAEACDGNEALQLIITHKPAVAFLDINMPGVSVFQSIPSLQNPPLIVFQTAYSKHAADAYDINAVDYLLKPIRFERLQKTVAKICNRQKDGALDNSSSLDASVKPLDHISVSLSGKTRLVDIKDIVRISLENSICYIYTSTDKLISDKYLSYYEEKLSSQNFFRTSRTDIINLDYIALIHKVFQGTYTVEMKNASRIDLSRRKAQELKSLIDF